MTRKPRILLCNEFSPLKTGYAKIGLELFRRLHASRRYELAELASYCFPFDIGQQKDPINWQMGQQLPWRVYPVNAYDEELNEFNSTPLNQFGSWRFEHVLLDFKPDFVLDIRDAWFSSFILKSPFRPYFHSIMMPAVDAEPQSEEWIDWYCQADGIFTYTDWAADLLRRQGGDLINVIGCNSPGADLDIFKPSGKKNIYQHISGDDIVIIGTVCRNQKRKLIPDLIEAFEQFINHCKEKGNTKLADKSYLYLHTSVVDLGWDIARLIKDSKVGHKIIFTYVCRNPNCLTTFPALFNDTRTMCPRCRRFDGSTPNTQIGCNDETLAAIINTFSVYVQFSVGEGLSVPVIEAAACGIPLMVTDYSGMEDFPKKLKAIPIKVQRFYREVETHRNFALPDNKDFIEQLYKFLTLPETLRKKRGFDTRKGVEKYFNFDHFAAKFQSYFDNITLKHPQETWQSQPKIHQYGNLQQLLQTQCSNSQFIELAIANVLGSNSHFVSQFVRANMLKQLNYGSAMTFAGNNPFTDMSFLGNFAGKPTMENYNRQSVLNELKTIADNINHWESIRCGMKAYQTPRFIRNGTKMET